jgi:integrase
VTCHFGNIVRLVHDSWPRANGGGGVVTGTGNVLGAAPELFVVGASPLLRPDEQVFEAMLAGWRDQQLSRNLAADTIESRLGTVRRFQQFTNDWPWSWRPVDMEEFSAEARGRGRARSTIRGSQCAIRLFCEYVSDPRYQWTAVCQRQFGTHPAQICFDWNTASHTSNDEGDPGRRALTKRELQDLFDYADERVTEARRLGRKGWLTALRDAAALKVCYAYGLRRRELIMLDVADFGPNPKAPEFGSYGVLYVRWGKASKGSPPTGVSRSFCPVY